MEKITCVLSSFVKEQLVYLQEDSTSNLIFKEDNIDLLGEHILDYCNANQIKDIVLGGSTFLKEKITEDIEDNNILKYDNKKINIIWVK